MTPRELLHELADVLANRLEQAVSEAEYYDQKTSPLPSTTHTRLVRRGVLPGYKVNGRVLVKRADMHRYIEANRVKPTPAAGEPDSERKTLEALLSSIPGKGAFRAA